MTATNTSGFICHNMYTQRRAQHANHIQTSSISGTSDNGSLVSYELKWGERCGNRSNNLRQYGHSTHTWINSHSGWTCLFRAAESCTGVNAAESTRCVPPPASPAPKGGGRHVSGQWVCVFFVFFKAEQNVRMDRRFDCYHARGHHLLKPLGLSLVVQIHAAHQVVSCRAWRSEVRGTFQIICMLLCLYNLWCTWSEEPAGGAQTSALTDSQMNQIISLTWMWTLWIKLQNWLDEVLFQSI